MKKFLSICITLVLTLLVVSNGEASAQSIGLEDYDLKPGKINKSELDTELVQKLDNRVDKINKYLFEIQDLEVALKDATENKEKNNILKKISKVEKKLKEIGVDAIPVEEEKSDDFSIASVGYGDFSVRKATIYYDNDMQMYVISSGWDWNNDDYLDVGSIGGDNVLAIQVLGHQVAVYDEGIRTYSKSGKLFSPAKGNFYLDGYGYAAKFKDELNFSGYNAHRGSVWFYFRFTNGTPKVNLLTINTRYGHSWNSNTITGLGGGPYSASISWQWQDRAIESESVSHTDIFR
ncbi:MAG: hypothetical protein ACQEV7_11415 [Bacillota bacterium]